ncbi:MAG: hypothetical protein ABH851_01550 [Methanobacteriota archaeon]
MKTSVRVLAAIIILWTCSTIVSASAYDWIIAVPEFFGWLFTFFIDGIVSMLNAILSKFFDIMEVSLLSKPTLYPLMDGGNLTSSGLIFSEFMKILVPLFVFSVMVSGAYMVFMAHSPSGRAQAKMIFDKLLVALIIIPLSPALYEVLLETNQVLTVSVVQVIKLDIISGPGTLGDVFYSSVSNAPISAKIVFLFLYMSILSFAFLALMTMYMRYLIVLTMGFVFPFTLFLYLHDWTKAQGTRLLKFTLIWIYAPTIMAVWLAIGASTLASSSKTGSFVTAAGAPFFLIVSLAMVFAAPLVMSGIMKWLGGIVSAVGQLVPGWWGVAFAAVGGVMQGKSVGSITGVGLKIGVNRMWGGGKALLAKAKGSKGSSSAGLMGGGGGALAKAAEGPKPKTGEMGPSTSMGGKPKPDTSKGGADKGGGAAGKAVEEGAAKAGGKAGAAAGAAAGRAAGTAAGAPLKALDAVAPGAGTAASKAVEEVSTQVGREVGRTVGEAVGRGIGKSLRAGMRTAGRAAWGATKGAAVGAAKGFVRNPLNPFGPLTGATKGAFTGAKAGLGGSGKSVGSAGSKGAGSSVPGNSTARMMGGDKPPPEKEKKKKKEKEEESSQEKQKKAATFSNMKEEIGSLTYDTRAGDKWEGFGARLNGMDDENMAEDEPSELA